MPIRKKLYFLGLPLIVFGVLYFFAFSNDTPPLTGQVQQMVVGEDITICKDDSALSGQDVPFTSCGTGYSCRKLRGASNGNIVLNTDEGPKYYFASDKCNTKGIPLCGCMPVCYRCGEDPTVNSCVQQVIYDQATVDCSAVPIGAFGSSYTWYDTEDECLTSGMCGPNSSSSSSGCSVDADCNFEYQDPCQFMPADFCGTTLGQNMICTVDGTCSEIEVIVQCGGPQCNSSSASSEKSCTSDIDCYVESPCTKCELPNGPMDDDSCSNTCDQFACSDAGVCKEYTETVQCTCKNPSSTSSDESSSASSNSSNSSSSSAECETNADCNGGTDPNDLCPPDYCGSINNVKMCSNGNCVATIGDFECGGPWCNSSAASSQSDSSISSSDQSSSGNSETSYSYGTLECIGNECEDIGDLVCNSIGQACITINEQPCFACVPTSSSSSPRDFCLPEFCETYSPCANGDECINRPSTEHACYTCIPPQSSSTTSTGSSSITSSSVGVSSSLPPLSCFGNECENVGEFVCTAIAQSCVQLDAPPCFECVIPANPSSASSASEIAEESSSAVTSSVRSSVRSSAQESSSEESQSRSSVRSDSDSSIRSQNDGNTSSTSSSIIIATNSESSSSSSGCTNNSECPQGQVCIGSECTSCGNGYLDLGEQCDVGLEIFCTAGRVCEFDNCSCVRREEPGCKSDAECGIGRCIAGSCFPCITDEECAIGRCINNACQLPTVTLTAASSICGNGVRELQEECDDGNTNSRDGCSASCIIERSICGNGIIEGPEYCDDGNLRDRDGCSSTCRIETSIAAQNTVIPVAQPNPQIQVNPQDIPVQGITFPAAQSMQPLPIQLPLATLQPLIQSQGPIGDTGPATVAVVGAGAASGIAWMRRRKRNR